MLDAVAQARMMALARFREKQRDRVQLEAHGHVVAENAENDGETVTAIDAAAATSAAAFVNVN